jgi:protein phosphatase
MGTTMTVALVGSDGLVAIGHVGDSRAYVLRDGALEQLTDDHSLVAELVRRGELSPAEAEVHPQRSVITRALGTDPDVDVDTLSVEARPGDVFLLCSDGLSTMVDTDTISQIVSRNRHDLESATRALIKAANDEGGEDNITAVLFAIDGAPASNGAPEAATAIVAPHPEQAADRDADTLHPEDGVPALTAAAVAEGAHEPQPEGTGTGDTVVIPAAAVAAAIDGPAAAPEPAAAGAEPESGDEAAPAEEEEPFPVLRLILATLLIIALAAIAVALVLWGLAR